MKHKHQDRHTTAKEDLIKKQSFKSHYYRNHAREKWAREELVKFKRKGAFDYGDEDEDETRTH